MPKNQKFTVYGVNISPGPDLPELSPYTKLMYEIIREIALERNTPEKVSFTLEELNKRLIAKGYDPETGEKIGQNKDSKADQ